MRGDVLYPMRKRCRRCRRFFGPLVVAGLWCSYHCAGHPVPSDDPAEWPRHHLVPSRPPKPKRQYLSEAEAAARPHGAVYLCWYCLTWHISSPKPEVAHAAV